MATYAEIIYCKNCDYYKSYYHSNGTFSCECLWWLRKTSPHEYCSKARYKGVHEYKDKETELTAAWARWENDEVWNNE